MIYYLALLHVINQRQVWLACYMSLNTLCVDTFGHTQPQNEQPAEIIAYMGQIWYSTLFTRAVLLANFGHVSQAQNGCIVFVAYCACFLLALPNKIHWL